MNKQLINRLSTHIWATESGKALANDLIALAGQNHTAHTYSATFTVFAPNESIGDLARCLGFGVDPPSDEVPHYTVKVDLSDRVTVLVQSAYVGGYRCYNTVCHRGYSICRKESVPEPVKQTLSDSRSWWQISGNVSAALRSCCILKPNASL